MDRLSAEAIIRDRITNGIGFPQIGEVVNGQLVPGIGIIGWAFTIDTEFLMGGSKTRAVAVIRMTGGLKQPYFVLYQGEMAG